MVLHSRVAALCCATLAFSACGGGTSTPTPASTAKTLVVVAGDAQTATVGTVVTAAPTVLVQDGEGRAVAGASVTFAVTSGGGSVTPASAGTNANGLATAAWTLGTTSGTNVLTVSTADATAKTLSATGTADIPSVVKFAATDTIFIKQGETQAQSVTLADKYGNAVSTSAVTPVFSVVGSAITVNASGLVTGVGPGIASVVATAGTATASRPAGITGHPTGNTRQSVSITARPFGLAVSGTQALVTQLDNNSVTRVNIAAVPTIVSQIAVSGTPTGISVTPNGATAFVANQSAYSIGVIDVASGHQTKTFPFPSSTFRTLVSRDGSRAYWTTSGGGVTSYNVVTGAVISTLNGFGPANGIALGPGDSTLYVSAMSGTLSKVNLKTGTSIVSASLAGALQDVVVSPAGDELYIADEAGRLLFASPALIITNAVQVAGAFGVALSPDGAQLWVTQPSVGSITVVDRTSRSIVKVINVAGVPRRIAFDRFGVAVVTDEAGALHVLR